MIFIYIIFYKFKKDYPDGYSFYFKGIQCRDVPDVPMFCRQSVVVVVTAIIFIKLLIKNRI